MDSEFVDDAKLLAITVVFGIGVVQLGRWSWCALRHFRDGEVHGAEYRTAQLMSGRKKMEQLRSRHKLQPTVVVS